VCGERDSIVHSFISKTNKKFVGLLWSLDIQKIVTNRVRYVLDTDTFSIRPDIHIKKISVKFLFLNKKIISDIDRVLICLHVSLFSLFDRFVFRYCPYTYILDFFFSNKNSSNSIWEKWICCSNRFVFELLCLKLICYLLSKFQVTHFNSWLRWKWGRWKEGREKVKLGWDIGS
jgi:hypothetical protein